MESTSRNPVRETDHYPPAGAIQVGQIQINGRIRPIYLEIEGVESKEFLREHFEKISQLAQRILEIHGPPQPIIGIVSEGLLSDDRQIVVHHREHSEAESAWTNLINTAFALYVQSCQDQGLLNSEDLFLGLIENEQMLMEGEEQQLLSATISIR